LPRTHDRYMAFMSPLMVDFDQVLVPVISRNWLAQNV
jgi:hypothetical protein